MSDPDNPYEPPAAEIEPTPVLTADADGDAALVWALHRMPTWQLVVAGLLTFGVFWAHYVDRQTRVINARLERDRIGRGLVLAIYATNYTGLALLVPYFMDTSPIVERVSDATDRLASVFFLVWGFMARNRMNTLLRARPGMARWFHGGWTFFFNILYFNYQVNTLHEAIRPTQADH